MATVEERDKFRQLAGKQLPVDPDPAAPYTDEQADAYLAAAPACPLRVGGGVDVYGAAANAWEDKADLLEVQAVESGGDAPLVTQVSQGDAGATYARPTPLGTTALQANDPASMRALASRLRKRSCNGGRFRSVDVLPPDIVRPADTAGLSDYDGDPYTDPRSLYLADPDNPDLVLNLPEVN